MELQPLVFYDATEVASRTRADCALEWDNLLVGPLQRHLTRPSQLQFSVRSGLLHADQLHPNLRRFRPAPRVRNAKPVVPRSLDARLTVGALKVTGVASRRPLSMARTRLGAKSLARIHDPNRATKTAPSVPRAIARFDPPIHPKLPWTHHQVAALAKAKISFTV